MLQVSQAKEEESKGSKINSSDEFKASYEEKNEVEPAEVKPVD